MSYKLDKNESEIKAMIDAGMKHGFIAKQVNCTEATLSNWLKRKRKEWVEKVQK